MLAASGVDREVPVVMPLGRGVVHAVDYIPATFDLAADC